MKKEAYIATIEVRDLRAKVYPIFKLVGLLGRSGNLRPLTRSGKAHRVGERFWPERFSPSDLGKLIARGNARMIGELGVPEYLVSCDPASEPDKAVAQLWQQGQDLHLLKSIELTSFYWSPKD